jgi:mono/diheme cytochrome c family protein
MTTKTLPFRALCAAMLLPIFGSPGWSQTRSAASTWDRVFSDAQAARGRQQYEIHCASCHGDDLTGREARSLVGSQFWQSWGEDSLQSLFAYMKTSMPYSTPGSLAPQAYLELVAYILQKNEFPAGSEELTAERLPEIRVIRKEGPGPVPNFALVAVVGCLSQPGPAKWLLTSGSDAVRTRNPDASTGADRQRADAMPLGANTFELMSVPRTAGDLMGRKIEAKGLLIRGAPDRLNVTSLQPLDVACAP